MQQELIKMLEKVTEHIVICNNYDQRFSSTSYGVSLLKEAEALIEKAKKSANEPVAPMSESQRADMICAVAAICTGTSSRTVAATAIEWVERYYGITTPAAPSQEPVTLTDERLREIDDAHNWQTTEGRMAAYRAIIAAMREKEDE